MIFISLRLSLINAHLVGSFFGCQNLPAVFGAAEAEDQFIFCLLSLIIKRYTPLPKRLTRNLDHVSLVVVL